MQHSDFIHLYIKILPAIHIHIHIVLIGEYFKQYTNDVDHMKNSVELYRPQGMTR